MIEFLGSVLVSAFLVRLIFSAHLYLLSHLEFFPFFFLALTHLFWLVNFWT